MWHRSNSHVCLIPEHAILLQSRSGSIALLILGCVYVIYVMYIYICLYLHTYIHMPTWYTCLVSIVQLHMQTPYVLPMLIEERRLFEVLVCSQCVVDRRRWCYRSDLTWEIATAAPATAILTTRVLMVLLKRGVDVPLISHHNYVTFSLWPNTTCRTWYSQFLVLMLAEWDQGHY